MMQKKQPTEVKHNLVSRRTFLKGTAGAIAAALAAAPGGLFAAQGMFAPNRIRQNKTVILAIQAFAHPAIQAVIGSFEAATGLTVDFQGGPVSGTDMLTQLSSAYQAGTSPYDVVSDADESAPVFMRAGYLQPLDDIIPPETWSDFPASMAQNIEIWHSYDGAHYRIPHEFAIGYFFTRADWLAQKNLKAPTTWEEMVSVGKEFTDSANGIWGTSDGLQKGGLLYVFLAYLAAQAGGSIFDFDDGTAQAFQFLDDMIHKDMIFPETALNDDYTAQNNLYTGDKIAFMRQWPFFESVGEGVTDWFSADKMKIELPPAGPGGAKSWQGGWGFTVPKAAPNPDGAAELIRYLTSISVVPQMARGQSWFIIPRASILASFAGENNPIVNAMAAYSAAGVPAARPFHPQVSNAQTAVEDAASVFLSGQSSLSDAMAQGKAAIAALGT